MYVKYFYGKRNIIIYKYPQEKYHQNPVFKAKQTGKNQSESFAKERLCDAVSSLYNTRHKNNLQIFRSRKYSTIVISKSKIKFSL